MTVLSKQTIRRLGIVYPCTEEGRDSQGRSSGLSCCGYDITLSGSHKLTPKEFKLVAAREFFCLPNNIVGIVHDKSSLARLGLAVQNTVAEPGWNGFLTLELSNHGEHTLYFYDGDAIAQVVFHLLDEPTETPYKGRYQNQGPEPQESK